MINKLKSIVMLVPSLRFRIGTYKYNTRDLNSYSKTKNIPKYKLCIDYMLSTYKYKCCLKDYLTFDFFYKNDNARKKYVVETDGPLVSQFNKNASIEEKESFTEKNKFNIVFAKYISRKSIYCGDKTVKEITNFINSVDSIVVKPIDLNGGRGIKILDVKDIKNIDDFAKEAEEKKYLIEEKLKQHHKIEKLNPTSINTIRIVTVKDKENRIHIIGCIIRIGKKDSLFDNLSQGAIAFPINIETGIIVDNGKDLLGNCYSKNDIGNVEMKGFKIPNWEMLIDTIKQAALVVPNVRYIGWDVCIKEDSIELIEGNLYPGPRTYQLGNNPQRDNLIKLL